MLHYSLSAMLMAVLSCGVIMVFAAICFTNKKLLASVNYKMFSLLPGIAILRLLFPVKFSFAPVIALPDSWFGIAVFLYDPLFAVGSLDISVWRIFQFVWVIGSVVCLVKLIREQIILRRTVALYGNDVTHEGRRLLYRETAHYYQCGILLKAGISLLMIIYWWNPACYLLRGELRTVSEICFSGYVTEDARDQAAGYPIGNLADRFHMMSKNLKPSAKLLYAAVVMLTIIIFLLSYCFTFDTV